MRSSRVISTLTIWQGLPSQILQGFSPQTSTCRSWFTSQKWVLPLIELWHMKWSFLKGIYKAHWASRLGKGDISLRFAADQLGHKINPEKVNFYPGFRLAEVIFITMTLHFAR